MTPITDEQRDLCRCALLNACGDIRADNPELHPAFDMLTPTVAELLKEKVTDGKGLTRSEVQAHLADLNFTTTELAVLAILNYAVKKNAIQLQPLRDHPTIMACVRYLPV